MANQSDPSNMSQDLIYQSLFLLMDDAVIVFNHQRKIVQVNPVAETLLQMPQNKAIGQTLHDVMDSQHGIDLSIDKLPNDPIKLQIDGETHYYILNLKQMPEQRGYILIFDDVTHERNARVRVQQLLSTYSEYTHIVGHDVKSPLGVAIGYSNMLQSELEEGTEAHFFADEIFETSMRIMYICNELLLISELHRQAKADFAPVNLNSILDNVTRRFTKDIAEQNITLRVDDAMPIIQGNLPWVEEVLVDFFSHAIHDSSPSLVEMGAEKQDDGMVYVWIRHDGQALSPDEQATLFDMKVKLEAIRAEGHGLGLAVARLLIERLRGTVGVNGGQMIYFTLPADS